MSAPAPKARAGQDWQTREKKPRTPGHAMPYSDLGIEVPFLDYLGVQVLPMPDGALQIIIDLERQHMNGGMTTHGGLVMTLLDMAMAAAGRLADPQQRYCVTVEMKCCFMRPAGALGTRLIALGTLRHGGGSLAFCEAELRDQDGTLVATSSGTFKYAAPRAGADA